MLPVLAQVHGIAERIGGETCFRPANVNDAVGRFPAAEHRKSTRTDTRRQKIFEAELLRIAAATGCTELPVAFIDGDGTAWRMDRGCIGFAQAKHVIEQVADDPETHVVERVSIARVQLTEAYTEPPESLPVEFRRTERTERVGQRQFRKRVLKAYNCKCALTSTAVPDVLEAIHLRAARKGGTHATSNGVALRADLHRLYDSGLAALTLDTPPRFEIAPSARAAYHEWHMKPLDIPQHERNRPDRAAIAIHRKAFGLPDR